MSEWYVYMIRCNDNSLYTGISTDVDRRLQEHKDTGDKGAKYLKGKGPLTLVWQQRANNRSEASKYEHAIKKLSKQQKEQIIQRPGLASSLID